MIRSCLVALSISAATLAAAQSVQDRDYRLTVDVQLVQLPVSVLDKRGFSVTGLPQDFFSVYEDKVEQNISLFKQEDAPVSGGLLIDVSGSMLSKVDRLKAAARTFIQASNPDDELAVMTFADDVVVEEDFKRTKTNLNLTGNEGRYSHGTAVFDSVLEATRYVEQESSYEKKVLILVSDGEDNNSRYSLKEVLAAVSESKIIVYTIGLLSNDGYTYGVDTDLAKKALRQLAEVTGGAFFAPKNVKQVEEICRKIAHDVRNQYTIGYRPSNEQMDGSWRKVAVRVNLPKDAPNVKVRTKSGYYAPVGKRQIAQESAK